MGDPAEANANAFIKEAQKKLSKSGGFLGNLMGGGDKTDEAQDLYVKAGNSFKLAKNWSQAGKAFCEAAALASKSQKPHEAANNFCDASNCYKKVDANEAVNCLLKAVSIYQEMGKLSMAARQLGSAAEICEHDLQDMEKAMSNYERAADLYEAEEAQSQAQKALLKVAEFAAQLERYDKAIELYEKCARQSMDKALLKYTARDHFYKAALLRLVNDFEDSKTTLAKYEDQFPQLSDARETKLLKKIYDAIESNNVEDFQTALGDYDSMTRLDAWTKLMYVRIKRQHMTDEDDIS